MDDSQEQQNMSEYLVNNKCRCGGKLSLRGYSFETYPQKWLIGCHHCHISGTIRYQDTNFDSFIIEYHEEKPEKEVLKDFLETTICSQCGESKIEVIGSPYYSNPLRWPVKCPCGEAGLAGYESVQVIQNDGTLVPRNMSINWNS